MNDIKEIANAQMAHLVLPDIPIVIGTDSSQNQKSHFLANASTINRILTMYLNK